MGSCRGSGTHWCEEWQGQCPPRSAEGPSTLCLSQHWGEATGRGAAAVSALGEALGGSLGLGLACGAGSG